MTVTEAARWLLGESALPSAPKPPPDYGVFEREHVYPNGTKKIINRRADGSKAVTWKHLDGGQWKRGRGKAAPTLYEQGKPSETAYVVEGEKDAENLFALFGGYCVSDENGAGNGKWKLEYTERLKAAGVRNACIFADNNDIGAPINRKSQTPFTASLSA